MNKPLVYGKYFLYWEGINVAGPIVSSFWCILEIKSMRVFDELIFSGTLYFHVFSILLDATSRLMAGFVFFSRRRMTYFVGVYLDLLFILHYLHA